VVVLVLLGIGLLDAVQAQGDETSIFSTLVVPGSQNLAIFNPFTGVFTKIVKSLIGLSEGADFDTASSTITALFTRERGSLALVLLDSDTLAIKKVINVSAPSRTSKPSSEPVFFQGAVYMWWFEPVAAESWLVRTDGSTGGAVVLRRFSLGVIYWAVDRDSGRGYVLYRVFGGNLVSSSLTLGNEVFLRDVNYPCPSLNVHKFAGTFVSFKGDSPAVYTLTGDGLLYQYFPNTTRCAIVLNLSDIRGPAFGRARRPIYLSGVTFEPATQRIYAAWVDYINHGGLVLYDIDKPQPRALFSPVRPGPLCCFTGSVVLRRSERADKELAAVAPPRL